MTFALKVTPLAVRALSEGAVAVKRFQVRKSQKYPLLSFLSANEPMLSLIDFPQTHLFYCDGGCVRHSLTHDFSCKFKR